MFRIQIYVRSDQIKFSLLLDVFHFRISEDVKRYELQQKRNEKHTWEIKGKMSVISHKTPSLAGSRYSVYSHASTAR
jgi:hypothetical protein